MRDQPVIIEAALSGAPSRAINPHVPVTAAEVDADAAAAIAAGATIIHSHVDLRLSGEQSAEAYAASWRGIGAARPDAIFCPTATIAADVVERWSHVAMLAERGVIDMGVLDPGVTMMWDAGEDGLPDKQAISYVVPYEEMVHILGVLNAHRLGASIAIYEACHLRATLAFHRAGRLPPGTLVKLYFGGAYNWFSGRRTGASFGLPPTVHALEAYLDMLEGSGLAWAVAVIGGDCARTELARVALERGGHLRVGLEDHIGPDQPTNAELVREAADLCARVGRPVADPTAARALLGLPERRPAAAAASAAPIAS